MKVDKQANQMTPRKIINSLRKKDINILQVPQEFEHDQKILEFERKAGLRIVCRKGFDVISNVFFVEEKLVYLNEAGRECQTIKNTTFEDFESFYKYLDGDIYENGCYTFCHLSANTLTSMRIDVSRLMQRKAFEENTIDDYSLEMSAAEFREYMEAEQNHKRLLEGTQKINACDSYEKLMETLFPYETIPSMDTVFFLFNYLFTTPEDEKHFSTIMKYVTSGRYPASDLVKAMCSIYDPDMVLASFKNSSRSKSTIYQHRKNLQSYIQKLKTGQVEFSCRAYFDKKTHFYCEEQRGYEKGNENCPLVHVYKYFENFENFIHYRKGDLTYCDLSSAAGLDVDFSKYKTDKTTQLPIHSYKAVAYSVRKWFHKDTFYVTQKWSNEQNQIIKKYTHRFHYFFDFVAFLKGDLSGADLILCDGLKNLKDWSPLDFSGTRLTSSLCDKFGLAYKPCNVNLNLAKSFAESELNEQKTALELQKERDLEASVTQKLSTTNICYDNSYQQISYISDIHLMFKFVKAKCCTEEDFLCVIQKIVDVIAAETKQLLLINGDVSSTFITFKWFVERLSRALKPDVVTVFTLGNHELWDFPDLSLDEIVEKYRKCLSDNGMFLLHNDLLYMEDKRGYPCFSKNNFHLVPYEELRKKDATEIFEQLRYARYAIFGGLGFSGYNQHFNADIGLYRKTVDRKTDIKESQKIETLYLRLLPILQKKNTIILTHMPKGNWCRNSEPDKGLVYVSGHTHRNVFYDDGEQRIYADNQVGYHNYSPHLKDFLLDKDYDCFYDYDDGIYKISSDQYRNFYRGKNLSMTFTRDVSFIYMLKKKAYYCFIIETKNGALALLNGGAIKTLDHPNVQYYFNHMDAMICRIEEPLTRYTNFQKYIARKIIAIGGRGTIHGCIIDIDFFNHIYVNPWDLTVVGYWAADIILKEVYPSVSSLLETKRADLFQNYKNMLAQSNENSMQLQKIFSLSSQPEFCFDTEIYRASREIRKMQKLNSHILSAWYGGVTTSMFLADR